MRTILGGTVAAGLALAAGCYETVRIRPSELAKLNDDELHDARLGRRDDPPLVHVLDESGRVTEIISPRKVTIGLREPAQRLEYAPPIISSVSADGTLAIADREQSERLIPLDAIAYAEVKAVDKPKSLLVIGTVSLITAMLTTWIVVAAAR